MQLTNAAAAATGPVSAVQWIQTTVRHAHPRVLIVRGTDCCLIESDVFACTAGWHRLHPLCTRAAAALDASWFMRCNRSKHWITHNPGKDRSHAVCSVSTPNARMLWLAMQNAVMAATACVCATSVMQMRRSVARCVLSANNTGGCQ